MKPLSRELQEQIRLMTLTDKRQDEIAEAIGVHRNSVYRWQQRMGLHAWQGITEKQEKEILRLLKRHGTSWIGRHVGCGEYQVRAVAKKHGFRRRLGEHGYKFRATTAQFIKIMDYALAHTHSARAISRIVGTPYKPTLRICHEVCECERFITGRTLDSYFPMKWAPNKIGASEQTHDDAETSLRIVDFINQKCFDGQLPQDTSQLVSVAVGVCIGIFRRERPDVFLGLIELQKVKAYFEPHFLEAVTTLRQSQVGAVN